MGWDDDRGFDTTNEMGNKWGEAERKILEPALVGDVLGLEGEEDDRVRCMRDAGGEEEGQECVD